MVIYAWIEVFWIYFLSIYIILYAWRKVIYVMNNKFVYTLLHADGVAHAFMYFI